MPFSEPTLHSLHCDVLVAGGGSAGIAAAVSAARAGANVILIERTGFLGGMGTASLVHTVCGLYLLNDAPNVIKANPGFASEFARKLIETGAARGPVRMGKVDVLPHDPWGFALLADRLTEECETLQTYQHSEIHAVERTDENWKISFCSRGKPFVVNAAALVDATGDAVVTTLAGAAWQQVEATRLQRPAYVVKLAGVEPAVLDEKGRFRLAHGLAFAVKSGELPREALGAGFRAGLNAGECYITIDLAGDVSDGATYDPTDPATLTHMERFGRATAQSISHWLKQTQAGFAGSFVAAWPTRAGVRESRRLAGMYELTEEDVLAGRTFEDTVAFATWPMELREKPTGPKWRFPEGNRPAHIPLRALRSKSHPMLLAAGRCISVSHEALASVRVMGTCLATGEAAGLAAFLLIQNPSWRDETQNVLLAGQVNLLRTRLQR